MIEPFFLPEVESASRGGPMGPTMKRMEEAGAMVPPIHYLLGYKPAMTDHLNRLTEEAMRGASPLAPGMRELIAAFTSRGNQCVF